MEVYYEDPHDDVPVPKGSKIHYHCSDGRFPDGKTWRSGVCGKDGKFSNPHLEACTHETIKSSDDEVKPKKGSGIKRKAQSGGKMKLNMSNQF